MLTQVYLKYGNSYKENSLYKICSHS